MAFDALVVAEQLVAALRGPLEQVQRRDPDLARQARKATSSIALNVSEGRHRAGKDRFHLYRIAEGSGGELRTALTVAVAWGYVTRSSLAEANALLDREMAMLWKLTHG